MASSKKVSSIPPLVPPLPSTSKLATKAVIKDKTLSSSAKKKKISIRTGSSKISRLSPSTKDNAIASHNTRSKLLSSKPAATTTRSSSPLIAQRGNNQRRVLRYAETIESLFLLNDTTEQSHKDLCHSIVSGTLANDAASWAKALQLASLNQNKQVGSTEGECYGIFSQVNHNSD